MNSATRTGTTMVLRPPLALRWSVKGEYAFPVVWGDRVVLYDLKGGIVCFEDGQERWRYPKDVGFLVAGATVIATTDKRLVELDLASGDIVRDVECDWAVASVGIEAFLPEKHAFFGVKSFDEAEGIEVKELALIGVDDLKPRWSVLSRGRSNEVFGQPSAVGDGKVFVSRGPALVAFDLESGAQRWAASLGEFDETLRYDRVRPMFSVDRVVTSVRGGMAAFDAATGREIWRTQGHGASVVYGGRVYSQGIFPFKFGVLDVNDGRVLLEVDLWKRVEKKWGFKRVDFAVGLAVSETHFFMGDGDGRLYAFEKETGEPVWYHRPKGGNPYFVSVPVIANNRLYIATIKPGPVTPTAPSNRPAALNCYEEAAS